MLERVIQDLLEDVNDWIVDFIRWICCSRSNDAPCMLLKLVLFWRETHTSKVFLPLHFYCFCPGSLLQLVPTTFRIREYDALNCGWLEKTKIYMVIPLALLCLLILEAYVLMRWSRFLNVAYRFTYMLHSLLLSYDNRNFPVFSRVKTRNVLPPKETTISPLKLGRAHKDNSIFQPSIFV